jgi:diguanylate cyclase (GGDEF)-like protein/PAS domain S-box-containing protein
LNGTYDAGLVLLSIVAAMMASYVALDLASRVTASAGRVARWWLAGGAASMGLGIWSMHFIGMLAFQLPVPMSYSTTITALSLLIAMMVSGFALYTVSRERLGLRRLVGGGVLMGIGIASMHYTGMAGMLMSPPIRYDPLLFTLSIVVAMTASWAALWIAFQLRGETLLSGFWRKAGSAVVMGAAICGMHYIGMAAAIFSEHTMITEQAGLPNSWLAAAIAAFTFLLLSTTLLVSLSDARRARALALHLERTRVLARINKALEAEISERQRAEAQLQREREFLSALLNNLSEGIVACDKRGVLTLFNKSSTELHGLPAEAPALRRWAEHYDLYLADGRTPVPAAEIPLLRALRGELVRNVELVIAPKNRPARTVLYNGQALATPDGENIGAVVAMHDITERKLAEQRLVQLAHFDPLTGLPNRRQFYDSLRNAMAVAENRGWQVPILFLDLDRFKNINDTLGHVFGDELLRQVGQRVMECLRMRDTVGRLGGDEFGIILTTPSDPQYAASVSSKVIEALRRPFDLGGREVTVTTSIGITLYPSDSTDLDTLIRYADAAMYESKAAGRDTYRFYTAEMNVRALEKLDLESALRRALERDEFLLYYQPKIHIATGRCTGVEALLRWHRPGIGMVVPDDFIPALEETGLIVQVGGWAIDVACRQFAAWKSAGVHTPSIAVNISARQVVRAPLARDEPTAPAVTGDGVAESVELELAVAAAMRTHRIAAGELELELTETALMSNAEMNVRLLQRLKAQGVRISIDDFGTGYSSLAYLKRFPIDTIKIDRDFVRDITTDPDDAAIAIAVIGVAHSLKLKVVAEGVETAEQLAFLGAHGCDEAQGFYIASPMTADALARLFNAGALFEAPMRSNRQKSNGRPT